MNRYFTKEDMWMADKHMKDAPYNESLGKCKLKTQRDTTTYM